VDAAEQDTVDGVGAEVLLKRPAVGSALQSSISGTEMGGERERK